MNDMLRRHWELRDEAELLRAFAGGLLEERNWCDIKRELGDSTGANAELARDLASFAVDGGTLVIGLDEAKPDGEPLIEWTMPLSRADQLRGLSRWPEARVAYEAHLESYSDDLDGRHGYGLTLLAMGDLKGAIRELTWVLDRSPQRTDARYSRALAFSLGNDDVHAIADLDELIEATPQEWYLWSDRGGIYLR